MKKRVLKVNRPKENLFLPILEHSYTLQEWMSKEFYLGYEWTRTPGSLEIQGYYDTHEYLGTAVTRPSYLHSYNKNDFCHECFYGEVYLEGEVQTSFLPKSNGLVKARAKFGFGGLRVFYPTLSATGEAFELYLGSPGIGVPSVWKHPYKTVFAYVVIHPRDDGTVDSFFNYTTSESKAKKRYEEMLDGYAPYHDVATRYSDVQLLTSSIADFHPPVLYGHEYFETYKYLGLHDALQDAASAADGFHFSRLAGEIALDGLVINTISTLSQRVSKSLRKAGPLSSKLAACFKLLPSVYVAYQYGIAAPLREYAALPAAIQSQFLEIGPLTGQAVNRFRDFFVSSRVSLNVGSPVSLENAFQLSYLTRGGLSLDDIWDLVPLSFVVDWFLNISKFLEAGRSAQIYSELPVKSATFSTSFERDVPLPDGVRGSIHHRCYIREYLRGSSLPAEVFSFQLSDFRGTLSLQNVDEGIALFLSYFV